MRAVLAESKRRDGNPRHSKFIGLRETKPEGTHKALSFAQLASIVEIKRIQGPIFNSKEAAAEEHGLKLCKDWIDKRPLTLYHHGAISAFTMCGRITATFEFSDIRVRWKLDRDLPERKKEKPP
jgi:hypothetical protein